MSDVETVRAWFAQFGALIGHEVPEDVTLQDALDWFDTLPEDEIEAVRAMAKRDPELREFLRLGEMLVDAARSA